MTHIQITLSVLLLLLTAPALASDMTAQQIADKAERVSQYQGDDGRARVSMQIKDSQGRTRTRDITLLRKDIIEDDKETGDQRFYVYFHGPSDLRDTVFMVWKHPTSDDDRWLYLPALDLVRRIAAEDERSSFVGSDFFYEDVSGRSSKEDNHTIQEITDLYYALRSTPKKPDLVEFDHFVSYIHKESFVPVQVEYYKADGTKYREYTAQSVETIEGYPTVTKSVMKDLSDGGQTVLSYTQIDYNVGLENDLFTERYLRNPPRAQLTQE